MIEEVTIERLGAKGDGIAVSQQSGLLYVAATGPGDRVRVSVGPRQGDGSRGRLEEVLSPGPGRTEAACPHYGICGGCALQHLDKDHIAAFKRGLVAEALSRRGLGDVAPSPTVAIAPGTRRRAEFAVAGGKSAALGLHQVGGRRVVDIQECPVVTPKIAALLSPLRALLAETGLARQMTDIRITETPSGPDLILFARKGELTEATIRQRLATFAEDHEIARISWADKHGIEPVVQFRAPHLQLGGTTVTLPMRYFLQPSAEGERAIADIVCAATRDCRNVADLFAGCGSLSLPLSATAKVTAYDIDEEMIDALRRAASGRALTADLRDLARSPLTEAELKAFDAVVFDPPRAGARGQAEYLARSAVGTIVAVSCNPATLARDLRLLVDGGYRIDSVTPIDQFTWSAEVEAVAVLHRP